MANDYDLVQALTKYFDLQELKLLCFRLGVQFEDLSDTQGTRTGSAMALVQLMRRQGQIESLLTECAKMRPKVNWLIYLQPDTDRSPQVSGLNEIKRKLLEKRLQELAQEYEACYTQLGQALSEVEKVRLKRSLSQLELEIQQVESELAQLKG